MEGRSDRGHRRPGERRPAARRSLVHKSSVSCTGERGERCRREVRARRGARQRRTTAPLAGYIRVSTTEQGDNGVGLEAQLAELAHVCTGCGLLLGRVYKDVASGGSLDGWRDLRRALAAVTRAMPLASSCRALTASAVPSTTSRACSGAPDEKAGSSS